IARGHSRRDHQPVEPGAQRGPAIPRCSGSPDCPGRGARAGHKRGAARSHTRRYREVARRCYSSGDNRRVIKNGLSPSASGGPNLRLVALLLAAASARAFAQSPTIELLDPSYRADAAIDRETREPGAPRLRVAVGAGFGITPRFEGSDHYRPRIAPAAHLAYGPVFFGIGGLGVNLYRDPRWRFGASLSLGRGRKESDDQRLQGLGDVDRTVVAGLFAVYSGRS